MILEHEIPRGSKLYFGRNAKLKRHIESQASEILYSHGFEEIVTPLFSYLHHHEHQNEKGLLRLSNETNHQIILRHDSTPDVTRIITKRLGRSTNHRKWFYVQPVFHYPTEETHQIGAEILGQQNSDEILRLAVEIFDRLNLQPLLQLSNIQIPLKASEILGLDLHLFVESNIEAIQNCPATWLQTLLYAETAADLEAVKQQAPEAINREIDVLLAAAKGLNYPHTVFAPLFYTRMDYYEGLFFRFFEHNETVLMGGNYESESLDSCGLALYTDAVIEMIMNKEAM